MHLSRIPRARLCHALNAPEPMENLTRRLGGPQLDVKRDDCTGLAPGGNKTCKLDFLMGEAMAQGADCIVTQRAVQSNHARQCAAAAARLGMSCHILRERRVPEVSDEYGRTSNVFLDRFCGAEVSFRPSGLDMNKVYGISVRQPGKKQQEAVYKLACETAEYVGTKGGVARESVVADGGYVGPGYGQPTKETVEAVNLAARKEGILLDPVYSGKGMAGLIGLVRGGFF